MKAEKYTSVQMSHIDYQAMNTGPKKFRSPPCAQVHWAKHQGRQWFMPEKANKFDDTRYHQNADAAMKRRLKRSIM